MADAATTESSATKKSARKTPAPKAKAAAPPRGPEWPADNVERRPIDKLLPYARNAMLHTNVQVDAIAGAIKQFGWTNPVVVDEGGEIIAGHGRVMAARRLGLTSVPTVVARGWSQEQKKAYRIWDNQSARLSEWSPETLRLELTDLKLAGFDLTLTGFDPNALVSYMTNPNGPTAPEQFPSVGEDVATEHSCPKCGYRWSGKADAAPRDE